MEKNGGLRGFVFIRHALEYLQAMITHPGFALFSFLAYQRLITMETWKHPFFKREDWN